MSGLPFPEIDPIAIPLFGDFGIRWYALAYLTGILGGWYYARSLVMKAGKGYPSLLDVDDIVPWIVFGIILGGRLGYVLFYNFEYYLEHPTDMLFLWQGGMSFHGGLAGVIAAIIIFSIKRKINMLVMGDIVAAVVPIGLFFGRIANFINGELFGRITTVPWAVNFPQGGGFPRHPSQLYEAFLEGLVLWVILYLMMRKPTLRARHGLVLGVFLVGYGLARFMVEFVREPDPQIGLMFDYLSMGQMLCIPMMIAGGCFIYHAFRRHQT